MNNLKNTVKIMIVSRDRLIVHRLPIVTETLPHVTLSMLAYKTSRPYYSKSFDFGMLPLLLRYRPVLLPWPAMKAGRNGNGNVPKSKDLLYNTYDAKLNF